MVWAIVPVKAFREAKQRLRGALSSNQRATLARALMMHTLDVLGACVASGLLQGVLVTSPDPLALDLAAARGAGAIRDSGDGLNAALAQARGQAAARGAGAVLVVHADLPRLAPEDIRALLALAPAADVVIAPCRHGTGTNALYTRPPGALHYVFGHDSFAEHVAQAETSGLSVRACRRPGLAFDLDTPRDLAAWLAIDEHSNSRYDELARTIARLRGPDPARDDS